MRETHCSDANLAVTEEIPAWRFARSHATFLLLNKRVPTLAMAAFIDWQSLLSWPPPKPPALKAKPTSLALDVRNALASWTSTTTIVAVILGALLLLHLARSIKRANEPLSAATEGNQKDQPIDIAVRKALDQHIQTIEESVQQILNQRVGAIEDAIQKRFNQRIDALETKSKLDQESVQQILNRRTEATEDAIQKRFNQRIDALETKSKLDQESVQQILNRRTEATEDAIQKRFNQRIDTLETKSKLDQERVQQILNQRAEAIEDAVRKRFNQRIDALETKSKLDQEAIDSLHKAAIQRMNVLEEGIRIIDGRQLDQEATNVMQRPLNPRLEAIESSLQVMESRTRASSQRVETVDDGMRVIDSRTKALSQRMEAVEDNLGSVEGQLTLLTHDASRGGQAIEKLQKHVKTLPGNGKLSELNLAWEERLDELEGRIGQYQLAIEEMREEPAPTLSWSHIETQEIEPSGSIYTRRPSYDHTPSHSFDGSMPLTPSPSVRSYSFTSSSISHSPTTTSTPKSTRRRRLEMARFQDTTFASRQKLFAARERRKHSLG
jgi:hypothetical protein